MSNLTRGYGVAISCAVVLPTTAVFIRFLTQVYRVPPLVLAFWRDLYNVSLMYLPSSVVNMVATLEPACTAAMAFFLLDERMTRVHVAGSLMIVGGVVLLRLYEGWVAARAAGRAGPA